MIGATHEQFDPVDEQTFRGTLVSDVTLPVRARHVASILGLRTVGEMMDLPDLEYLRTPNFGMTTLKRLRRQFAECRMAANDTVKEAREHRDEVALRVQRLRRNLASAEADLIRAEERYHKWTERRGAKPPAQR